MKTILSAQHEDALYSYFGKEYAAVRSSMGGQLEAMAAAVLFPIPKDGDFIPVKVGRGDSRRECEVESLVDDARKLNRIERIVLTLEPDVRGVLALHYDTRLPPVEHGHIVVAVIGRDMYRTVVACVTSEDRDAKREAKKTLASAIHRAGVALEAAQRAYLEAHDRMPEIERTERQAAFAASMR